ncbi:hypothetical protein JCM24511_04931 [Saitozyma sp. JCM 24511]|nr:hypothetical protein JCM24511_04931 [Saitozyma sp. JCM 24511]
MSEFKPKPTELNTALTLDSEGPSSETDFDLSYALSSALSPCSSLSLGQYSPSDSIPPLPPPPTPALPEPELHKPPERCQYLQHLERLQHLEHAQKSHQHLNGSNGLNGNVVVPVPTHNHDHEVDAEHTTPTLASTSLPPPSASILFSNMSAPAPAQRQRELFDFSNPDQLLVLASFNHDIAWEIGSAIRARFIEDYPEHQSRGGPGIIVQVRTANGLVPFQTVIGDAEQVGPSNMEWAQAKYNSVMKYGKATLRFQYEINQKGKKPEDLGIHFPNHTVAGGAIPIWIKGCDLTPIGAVVVSGLPQKEDHQLILDTFNLKLKHLLA